MTSFASMDSRFDLPDIPSQPHQLSIYFFYYNQDCKHFITLLANEHYSLAIPPHFISMGRSTRLYHVHPSRYVLPNARTYSYQQSFYPRSFKDYNNLPSYLIECINFDSFSAINYAAKLSV